jgi:solute carrier family 35 (adenosine 3'-phospho 5'-phosphosulfate transporter), member B2
VSRPPPGLLSVRPLYRVVICARRSLTRRAVDMVTQPYGEEGELFTFSVFLVLNNRLVSMALAALVLAVTRGSVRPVAPVPAYAAVSISNVIATTCQYEALRYVSFPVQTLGKCGKMIPVMLWGRLMLGRRYSASDYAVAAAITAGATVFLLGGDVSSPAAKHRHGGHSSRGGGADGSAAGWMTSMYGCALMLGYLGCDGFTSTLQDRLFKGYSMETFNQMLWVTACSACLSALWLTVGDNTMGDAMSFVHRHPECLTGIWALSLSSAVGQLFILSTIKEFGALVFATVMTSRQFLSILLSCLLFMHPLTGLQWLGTACIFGALYYQAATKGSSSHKKGSHGGSGGEVEGGSKGTQSAELMEAGLMGNKHSDDLGHRQLPPFDSASDHSAAPLGAATEAAGSDNFTASGRGGDTHRAGSVTVASNRRGGGN